MNPRTIEDLARMFCEVDEFNADDRMPTVDIKGNPCTYPRWKEYTDYAHRAYCIAHELPQER